MRSAAARLALAALVAAGCLGEAPPNMIGGGGGGDGGGTAGGGDTSEKLDPIELLLAELPSGDAQNQALCARGHQDKLAQSLCGTPKPRITSLLELEAAAALFAGPQPPAFALLGHSTSVVGRVVSSLNPRAIIFTPSSGPPTDAPNDGTKVLDPGFVILSFVRGEQLAEVAAHDPQRNEINFYLIKFRQACNKTGCTTGDLYTPAVEKQWLSYTVYDDRDLRNTAFDCTHCHQPEGPNARKILRIHERKAPWTHWFRNNQNEPGGVVLLKDFQAAHANEDYAGIPAALLDTPRADPLLLEALIENNSLNPQPNEFRGDRIEVEVKQAAPRQPEVNDPPGRSVTWNGIFNRFVQGQAIPVPYHDVKITDAGKLASFTQAYRAVVTGQMPAAMLPDLSDVFLEKALPEMGFRPKTGLDGMSILNQMCARCHNGKADPALSKSKFDLTQITTMSRAEKDLAISRMKEPRSSVKIMPPVLFGELSPGEIAAAEAVLNQ